MKRHQDRPTQPWSQRPRKHKVSLKTSEEKNIGRRKCTGLRCRLRYLHTNTHTCPGKKSEGTHVLRDVNSDHTKRKDMAKLYWRGLAQGEMGGGGFCGVGGRSAGRKVKEEPDTPFLM